MVPLESKGRRLYDAMYDACPPQMIPNIHTASGVRPWA